MLYNIRYDIYTIKKPQLNLNRSGWVFDFELSWGENDILGSTESIGSDTAGLVGATGVASESCCLGVLKLNFTSWIVKNIKRQNN